MVKIRYFGYDLYELKQDLGSGDMIETKKVKITLPKHKDIDSCLKWCCDVLHTDFHRDDWNFEEDLDDKGHDGWVLHNIVERNTNKYATNEMINKWKKTDKPDLIDLLVNVFVEECK